MRNCRRGCTCNSRNPWDPCKACEAAADRLESDREFDDPDRADIEQDRYERHLDRMMEG